MDYELNLEERLTLKSGKKIRSENFYALKEWFAGLRFLGDQDEFRHCKGPDHVLAEKKLGKYANVAVKPFEDVTDYVFKRIK